VECSEAYRLVVQKPLSPADHQRLDAHLDDCASCREAAALLRTWTTGEWDAPEPPAPATTLTIGDTIGRFRIDEVLGAGGMSVVFAATHVEMPLRVAIKVLHRALVASTDANIRFTRDARLVAQLKSEHVCRLQTLGRLSDGEPYMVLELLDGEDLHRALGRGPLPVMTAVDYMIQACSGLAEAHRKGIVHRDIKPANLFRVTRPDGAPLIKLLDFGIAKDLFDAIQLTRTGAQIGSLPYMSPEQLRSSRSVDQRTDIWSLGVTLFHLIAGFLPFDCEGSFSEVAVRIWSERPRALPAEVPSPLSDTLARTLARDPADRPGNVAELARALAPYASGAGRADSERVERILGVPQQNW
jgi:eukaryotic-like serine/threonine-protein kinase